MRCHLSYRERDENTLLFQFRYGAIAMVINLLNRQGKWVVDYSAADSAAVLYPEHYQRKFGIQQDKKGDALIG